MVTFKEPTKRILLGTAGHIDHGKTRLVKLFSGCDTDRLPEEKKRGMSIDLGFGSCMLGGDLRIGIVDVPGHEKFIRNMVAGVSAIDLILLVVAADDGVMPQTREHIQIVELLGLTKGLVALTKIDMVDGEIRELALEDVKEFLQGTFLKDAPVIPVSSETGEGYEAFWYALQEVVSTIEPRGTRGVFRMPVERVFTVKGLGTVATGMPLTGAVNLDEKVELLPVGKETRVRGLQVFKKQARQAMAGDCVALNLSELNHREVHRGMVLGQPGYFKPTRLVDGRLMLLPGAQHVLKDGAPIRFHVGTSEVMGTVALLDRKKIGPGESGFAQFRLRDEVVVDARDRFVVRLQSPVVTVGGGVVIREQDRKLKRFKAHVLEDLESREQAISSDEGTLAFTLRKRGANPVRKAELARLAKLPEATVEKGLSALREKGALVEMPGEGGLMHEEALGEAFQALRAELEAFHKKNPFRIGMAATDLRSASGLDRNVFDLLCRRGLESGDLVEGEGVIGLKGRGAEPDASASAQLEAMERAFLEGGMSPPSLADAAKGAGVDVSRGRALAGRLKDQGLLVEVAEGMLFHRETVRKAREALVAHLKEHGEIGAVTFRDLVGGSRKYVYPLLDSFDVAGVTIRRGNLRYLKGER